MKSHSPIFGKNPLRILLVRPPGYLWPILNESDNFLLPLGLPCIAAYLREKMVGVEVEILDCCVHRIGWKKLAGVLKEKNPDVVGVGDLVIWVHEGIRVLKMAKEINPNVVTIGGGHFHSFMTEYSLDNYPDLDYIVRWEGEESMRQLLETLRSGGDLANVGNLAYREGGKVKQTAPLAPIDPLDSLPIPAYDMVHLEKYSPFGLLWPRAATIQGNRGCPYNCRFCSWSAMEGDHYCKPDGTFDVKPAFRTKSAARILEEIDLLHNKHKVRYLFWVEGTWNYSNEIMNDLSEGIIKRGYKLGWWAFVRPDKMLEQEDLGILPKMVKAGLSHVLLGGERQEDDDLALIGKTDTKFANLYKLCRLLEKKYPTVFRQATFVMGIPTDTPEKIEKLGKDVRSLHLDFAAFHPLMPYPGTDLWEKYKDTPVVESTDFSKYDMFHPIIRPYAMSREEVAKYTEKVTLDFVQKQPHRYLMGMFSRIGIRRRLHWWFLFSMGRVILLDLWHSIIGRRTFRGYSATSELWKPKWYDR